MPQIALHYELDIPEAIEATLFYQLKCPLVVGYWQLISLELLDADDNEWVIIYDDD